MTVWVLLRGLTREAGHWGAFTRQLADRLDAADEVVAVDLPGNGVLHAVRSPASVYAMVAACREDLTRRGLRPPYLPVALSLGGMVALQWANEFADEVAGCVLINTSLGGHSPFWERLRPRSYLRLCRLLLPGLSVLQREREVLAMTSGCPQRHPGVAAQWAAIAEKQPVSRSNALRQLFAAARYIPSPNPPPVPILVLASLEDRLVSTRCSQRLASRWSLPICVHPRAGHDLPLDEPDWVAGQVAGWWRHR